MTRTIFVDDAFLPAAEARVPVMIAVSSSDAVCEVSAVLDGGLVDDDAHLARLHRSFGEIGIRAPHPAAEWRRVQEELVGCDGPDQGSVRVRRTAGAERGVGYAAARAGRRRDGHR